MVIDAHLRIRPTLLGHVAKEALLLAGDRGAAPVHLPGSGLEHAQRDAHRRGLARAVGPSEPDDIAIGALSERPSSPTTCP
jgi:hypothetical protein